MSEFTKGPWKLTKHLDVMKGARFIAAAPYMYELITGAMKPETFDYQLYWNQARALLARIDGKEERHE